MPALAGSQLDDEFQTPPQSGRLTRLPSSRSQGSKLGLGDNEKADAISIAGTTVSKQNPKDLSGAACDCPEHEKTM